MCVNIVIRQILVECHIRDLIKPKSRNAHFEPNIIVTQMLLCCTLVISLLDLISRIIWSVVHV